MRSVHGQNRKVPLIVIIFGIVSFIMSVSAYKAISRLNKNHFKVFRTPGSRGSCPLSITTSWTSHPHQLNAIDQRRPLTQRNPAYSSTRRYSLSTSAPTLKSEKMETQSLHPESLSDRITVVRDRATAEAALRILNNHPSAIWACDTEVADIDVSSQSPVGNGQVICISIYGGPQIDFGKGPGGILWIENMDDSDGIALLFKDWFESNTYKKVWHNYGFDRHVMYNMGIDCKGFYGDTMHMARVWDTSLDKMSGGEGYSLESLSVMLLNDETFKKISMKDLFGQPKQRKDGSESKIKELPSMRELQSNPQFRDKWIEYSSRDALATWEVYDKLSARLLKHNWVVGETKLGNMMDYYNNYLLNFGELLTDMERNGIMVDTTVHLKDAEKLAREERAKMETLFLDWAAQHCSDSKYINPASSAQIQQLFFGKYDDEGMKTLVHRSREFKMDKDEEEFYEEQSKLMELNPYINWTVADLKTKLKKYKVKVSGKRADLVERLLSVDKIKKQLFEEYNAMDSIELKGLCEQRNLTISSDNKEELVDSLIENSDFSSVNPKKASDTDSSDGGSKTEAPTNTDSMLLEKAKRQRTITIRTLGMEPLAFTPKGQPQVSAALLKQMAGRNLFGDEKDAVWGTAYKFFGEGEKGKEACRAIGALAAIGQIDATITNFLVPLQALVDKNSRIHCSLNLNTETGRLSSRRPNLQNQPALEKDQYKIRDAFIASPGNTLIVADYGQLELRLLAHITSCQSMITAFKQGGCFHSRTAVGMYDYIKEAVESGKVLLEWDYSKGQPTVPLVKDTYGSERRKAKTLNFSIAYGKTVHGLAQDWGITREEAEETLQAWYRDRPEVKKWQENTKGFAMKNGFVRTLMGRYRNLPDATGPPGAAQGHALRAAINTPIQGSAADVVIMAMIKLCKSEVLKDLGWKLLLQIHDEVILEGPKESMKEALAEVRSCMENPFDGFGLKPLSVHLDVDAKSADSWYKAK